MSVAKVKIPSGHRSHEASPGAFCDKMAADPATQKWWDVCKPCQIPLDNRGDGEWWASMEEVFHQD